MKTTHKKKQLPKHAFRPRVGVIFKRGAAMLKIVGVTKTDVFMEKREDGDHAGIKIYPRKKWESIVRKTMRRQGTEYIPANSELSNGRQAQ